jgi:hypothetical protein
VHISVNETFEGLVFISEETDGHCRHAGNFIIYIKKDLRRHVRTSTLNCSSDHYIADKDARDFMYCW